MSAIGRYLSLSPGMTCSRSIRIVACASASFLFMAESYSSVFVLHWQLGVWAAPLLTVMGAVALSADVGLSPPGRPPTSGNAGPRGNLVSTLLRTRQALAPRPRHFTFLPAAGGAPGSHVPLALVGCSRPRGRGDDLLVLSCVSLTTNGAEHCSLAICVSSLGKYLCTSFAHF